MQSTFRVLIDLVCFGLLSWFLWGGRWTGSQEAGFQLKGAFIRDGQVALASIYILGRLFFNVRFRETLFGKALWRIFLKQNPSTRPIEHLFDWTLRLVFLGLASLFFITPLLQYRSYGNYIFDLGIFDQVIWSGAHLGSFSTTFLNFDGINRFAYFPYNHLNFGLWFFSLLYKFHSSTEMLLIFQSLVLAGSLVPLLLIARNTLPKLTEAPFFIVILFISWEPFFRMNTWDFHETPFACFFFLWGFYFYLRPASSEKNFYPSLLFFFLGSLWRADLWLTFSALIWVLYLPDRLRKLSQKGNPRKWANDAGFYGLVFLGLTSFMIFPFHSAFFNQVNTLAERYPFLGANFSDLIFRLRADFFSESLSIFQGIFDALIQNRSFFLRILLNTGFFCLLAPRYCLIALPAILEIGLSTREGTATFVSHYTGLFSAPILVATLLGWRTLLERSNTSVELATSSAPLLENFSRKNHNQRILWISLSLAIAFSQNGYHLIGTFKRAWHRLPEARCLDSLLSLIPSQAAVLAHDPVAARLAQRAWITSPQISKSLDSPEADYSQAEWLILPVRNLKEQAQSEQQLSALQLQAKNDTASKISNTKRAGWILRQEGCGHVIYSRENL